ncbi:MAG: HIT family protein [Capsulimonadaceae bacterium]
MDRLYAPWRMAYVDQPDPVNRPGPSTGCVFCDKAASDQDSRNLVVHRGEHCFVLLNLYPYNNGHLMVVPYAHLASFQDLEAPVLLDLMLLARHAQTALEHALHPEGYNMGMNLGRAAGAGIADHLHLHIVPRWNGDTNFMPVLGDTKVMPDALESSCMKIRRAWPADTLPHG